MKALVKAMMALIPYRIVRDTGVNRFQGIYTSLKLLRSLGYQPSLPILAGARIGPIGSSAKAKKMKSEARISVIEAMRGIASMGVALFHFSGQMSSDVPRLFQSLGWLGVDIFFVISGFVIPLSLYGRDYSIRKFPSFLFRRVVRLEPPYIISIGLVLLMWQLSAMSPGFRGPDPNYSLVQIAFHLFYMIPLTSYSWLNLAYWSLAYEFVFYIIVGLTFSSLINREIEFTILVVAIVEFVCFYLQAQFDPRPLEFAVGILLMRFVVDRTQRAKIGIWIVICLTVIFWAGGLKIGGAVFLAAGAILFLRRFSMGNGRIFSEAFLIPYILRTLLLVGE